MHTCKTPQVLHVSSNNLTGRVEWLADCKNLVSLDIAVSSIYCIYNMRIYSMIIFVVCTSIARRAGCAQK